MEKSSLNHRCIKKIGVMMMDPPPKYHLQVFPGPEVRTFLAVVVAATVAAAAVQSWENQGTIGCTPSVPMVLIGLI